MDRPRHYSLDIPARCSDLIDHLEAKVVADKKLARKWGGPLRTTFLLAMATPMVVLPIERIFKPAVLKKGGVADDSDLDPALRDRVADSLGEGRIFGDGKFFGDGDWRYIDGIAAFNVSEAWPEAVLHKLRTEEAAQGAREAPASAILLLLRNALAHGGFAYLDSDGLQQWASTAMIAFVGRAAAGQLRVARIGIDDFRRFLSAWADWLAETGVEAEMNQMEPGWLLEAAE